MKKIHEQEKQQFKKLLKQAGTDDVEKHYQVLETFLMTENHVTADELVLLLSKRGIPADIGAVKNTLNLLVHYGFAEKIHFDDRQTRYEHKHLGLHHDHLICTKCGRITEFMDDQLELLQARIAEKHHFHMLLHKMEIYGICPDCLKGQSGLLSLDMAKTGQRLVIRKYAGGEKAVMRLVNMGLRIGDRIEVITNTGRGQLVIAVDYNRYVLGRGMACKIMVEPVKSD